MSNLLNRSLIAVLIVMVFTVAGCIAPNAAVDAPAREANVQWDDLLTTWIENPVDMTCDAPGGVLLVDTADGRYLEAAGVTSLDDQRPVVVDDRFENLVATDRQFAIGRGEGAFQVSGAERDFTHGTGEFDGASKEGEVFPDCLRFRVGEGNLYRIEVHIQPPSTQVYQQRGPAVLHQAQRIGRQIRECVFQFHEIAGLDNGQSQFRVHCRLVTHEALQCFLECRAGQEADTESTQIKGGIVPAVLEPRVLVTGNRGRLHPGVTEAEIGIAGTGFVDQGRVQSALTEQGISVDPLCLQIAPESPAH